MRGTWKQFNEYMHMRGLVLYETNSKRWTEIEEKKYTRATRLTALGRLLVGDGLFFTHGGDNGNKEILAVVEVALDLLAEVTLGDTDIILGGTILSHQVEETVIDVDLRRSRSSGFA